MIGDNYFTFSIHDRPKNSILLLIPMRRKLLDMNEWLRKVKQKLLSHTKFLISLNLYGNS